MSIPFHKIKTVIKYIPQSWRNSKILSEKIGINRIRIFLSLLYWYYFYGFDFNDYCSFKFWRKSKSEKKSYISFRRNNILRFALSNPEIYKLFLNKAKFNERFGYYIKRKWISSENAASSEIERFLREFPATIIKPLSDFGGHGVMKFTNRGG